MSTTKCHYMAVGKKKEQDTFEFRNISLNSNKQEVILGLTIDNKPSFDSHTFEEKLAKEFVHDLEYEITYIQNKKKYF